MKVIHRLYTGVPFDKKKRFGEYGNMLKNVVKFLGVALGIVALGWGTLLGLQYWKYKTSPEYRTLQGLKNLEKQYAEDPYGGDTPEETLRLFVEALKKSDTDLAAKYFVLDKQQQWREDLVKIKERGLLNKMVEELNNTKLTKKAESEAYFTLTDKNNLAIAELIIGKSKLNKKWKIYEL